MTTIQSFLLCCRTGALASSSFAVPPADQVMMQQLRQQVTADVLAAVTEALRGQNRNRSPHRRRPRSPDRSRKSRYDDYISEYLGDTDDSYYDDDYEDSYSDFSDNESRGSSSSFTPAAEGDKNPTPTEGAAASNHPGEGGHGSDPVVQSKSLDVLLAKYAASGPQEEPDPSTNPILDSLVPQLKKWFHGYVAPSEIKCLQEKVERPVNATCLKPIKINAELYYAISSDGIHKDKPLSYIGQVLAKGSQPLVSLWSALVTADVKVKDAKGTKEDTILEILDGCTINISQMHDQLALALMIIGNANVQIAQMRRDNFKPYVHYDYHELLRHSNPLGDNIFGDNLKEKIGNISKIKQVTRQIKGRKRCRRVHNPSSSSSGFLGGRGGGRNRLFRRQRRSHTHGKGQGRQHNQESHHQGQSSSSQNKQHHK